MTGERDLLAARIILNAVLPVAKVIFEVTSMSRRFQNENAKFQIMAKNGNEKIGAYFVFKDGTVEVVQGIAESPDIRFTFNKVEGMNAFLTGGIAVPSIKGFTKPLLLIKCILLLLSLTILLPTKRPEKYDDIKLKVHLIIYMITTAMSQYNKGGDPDMMDWTKKQPDRIYQMSCEPEGIAAYVRIKAGKSKAGRGYYKKRRPFVHMKFKGVENALPVFLGDIEFVEAVGKGNVEIIGSPEYAAQMNDFMQRIQALIT